MKTIDVALLINSFTFLDDSVISCIYRCFITVNSKFNAMSLSL